jgi:hypothetical protein
VKEENVGEVSPASADAVTELICPPLSARRLDELIAFNWGALRAATCASVIAPTSLVVSLAMAEGASAAIWLGVWPMTIEVMTNFLPYA